MEEKYNLGYIIRVVLVAAMGGLLFGYDWVVIGGAKPFYEAFFGLDDPFRIGWAQNSAVVGCLVGALISGGLSDRFGRKRLLILSALLFTVSAIGVGWANSFPSFLFYRFVCGAGMGLASALSPVYIAEITPAKIRGSFVSVNQLAIVVGILAAQITNWLIAQPVADGATAADILQTWNGQMGWRWMFWAGMVPATVFVLLMFLVPESPRWLVKFGAADRARGVLARVGGDKYADFEVQDIRDTLASEEIRQVRFQDLFSPGVFKIVLVGIFLAVFQQWCGINVVMQYAEEVFHDAGFNVDSTMINIVYEGLVFLAFTFVAIFTVDWLGRKTLMLAGALGLALTYALLGWAYRSHSAGGYVLVLVLCAIAIYSFSLAPITWVLLSEIFPNRIRGAAMSVAVFFLWFGNGTLTLSFPYLHEGLGIHKTFWLYGVICVGGFLFMLWQVPETKGKSLEDIERQFVD